MYDERGDFKNKIGGGPTKPLNKASKEFARLEVRGSRIPCDTRVPMAEAEDSGSVFGPRGTLGNERMMEEG